MNLLGTHKSVLGPGQSVEGQVIIMQAEDLMQTKKLIPDLPTWLQCFALFVLVAAKHKPERLWHT